MKRLFVLFIILALVLNIECVKVLADDTNTALNLEKYSAMNMNVYSGSRVTSLKSNSNGTFTIDGYMFNDSNCNKPNSLYREVIFINASNLSTEKAYRQVATSKYNTFLNKNTTATQNGKYDLSYAFYSLTVNPNNISNYAKTKTGKMEPGSYYVYMRISDGKTSYLFPLMDRALSDGSTMESSGTLPKGFVVINNNRELGYLVDSDSWNVSDAPNTPIEEKGTFTTKYSTSVGGMIIDKYSGNESSVTIPTDINGNKIMGINSLAFAGTSVKEVIIPSSVINSDVYGLGFVMAFSKSNIEKIIFEEGTKFIPSSICNGALKLAEVTIPSTVTSIGKSAFSECVNLKEISLPKDLTKIGSMAFYKTGISEVELPSKLTLIDTDAFAYTNIKELSIPKYLTDITNSYAFRNCINLKSVNFEEGTEIIHVGMFYGCTSLKEVIVPDSVKSINMNAFTGCSSLDSIELKEGIKVSDSSFEKWVNITYK